MIYKIIRQLVLSPFKILISFVLIFFITPFIIIIMFFKHKNFKDFCSDFTVLCDTIKDVWIYCVK
jgi:hypothetical protein